MLIGIKISNKSYVRKEKFYDNHIFLPDEFICTCNKEGNVQYGNFEENYIKCKYCNASSKNEKIFFSNGIYNKSIKIIDSSKNCCWEPSYVKSTIRNMNKKNRYFVFKEFSLKKAEIEYWEDSFNKDIEICSLDDYKKSYKSKKIKTLVYENKNLSCFLNNKKQTEIDTIDFFNINRMTLNQGNDILNESQALKMLENNEEYLKTIGFDSILLRINFMNKYKVKVNNLLLLYLSLYYTYPVIELLVKMGHLNLLCNVFMKVLRNYFSKEKIKEEMSSLTRLINPYSTKGKESLIVPFYIGEYVKQLGKYATKKMYDTFTDFYLATNISKENFEKFIGSDDFILFRKESEYYFEGRFDKYISIMKYGMKNPIKLLKYILMHDMIIIYDTYHMADQLDIKLKPYEENVQIIHDEISKEFAGKEDELKSKVIKQKHDKFYDLIGEKKDLLENEKYILLYPSSVTDILDEGIQQHHCVGSYIDSIIQKKSIVVFVREKDNIKKSYATIEVNPTSGKIVQAKYKFNNSVKDNVIFDLVNKTKKYLVRI